MSEADLLHGLEGQVTVDLRRFLRPRDPEPVRRAERRFQVLETTIEIFPARREEDYDSGPRLRAELLRERRARVVLVGHVDEVGQSGEQAIDLVLGVVVHDPGPHCAVVETQVAHRLERVVVAVPNREITLGEERRDRSRGPFGKVEAEGRHAPVHRSQAVELDSIGEPVEEPLAECRLVGLDRVPAERVEVVHGRDEACEQLVRERSELEAMPHRLVGRGANLVRPPRLQQVVLAEGQPQVGPEELVRRADEDVRVPGGGVDRAVRSVVHGVGPRQSTRVVGKSNDAIHIRSGADRVGRNGESHHPRALREQAFEVLVVDFEITGESRHADDRAQGHERSPATERRSRRDRAS